jgi:hypothetical protein
LPKGAAETMKILVIIADLQAKVLTWDLPNTKQDSQTANYWVQSAVGSPVPLYNKVGISSSGEAKNRLLKRKSQDHYLTYL